MPKSSRQEEDLISCGLPELPPSMQDDSTCELDVDLAVAVVHSLTGRPAQWCISLATMSMITLTACLIRAYLTSPLLSLLLLHFECLFLFFPFPLTVVAGQER